MGSVGSSCWGLASAGGGRNPAQCDGQQTSFYRDRAMSFIQLIVYALEMRRMAGVTVPEGAMGRLKAAWDDATMGGFEVTSTAWVNQLQRELMDPGSTQGSKGRQILRMTD